MSTPAPYKPRQLTEHLRRLAAEAHTTDADGRAIDKGEALARALWDRALGYTVLDPKTGKEERHEPKQWAQTLVLERLDGKVPQAIDEPDEQFDTTKKVSEETKKRIAALMPTPTKTKARKKDK